MARQEIAIYSQNVVRCLKFLMRHPSFQHNQIYELFRIFNKNEQQVCNELHTDE